MRAWWGLVAGAGLIVLGYLGDRIALASQIEGSRTFAMQSFVVLDGALRVVAVGLMVGLGWLVKRGPRARIVGIVLLVLGGYVALAPALTFTLLANSGIALPLAVESMASPTDLTLWAGAAVFVLGLTELAWPTPLAAT